MQGGGSRRKPFTGTQALLSKTRLLLLEGGGERQNAYNVRCWEHT